MPTLLNYRHKVAAHFAITDPRRDNEADLMASVMTQVVFTKGYLSAAALTQRVTRDGIEIGASRNLSWSLTMTHERLVTRYWPDGPPRAFQALRLPPKRKTWMDVRLPDDALGEG